MDKVEVSFFILLSIYNVYVYIYSIHITYIHKHITHTHIYTLEGERAHPFRSTSLHFGVMVSLDLDCRDITLWIWDEPEN